MRYLLVGVLLLSGLSVQASPATFYRALKHLGFDPKRIATIATDLSGGIGHTLGEVFADKSLKNSDKAKLLIGMLEVRRTEMADTLALPYNASVISNYRNGMIPRDEFDRFGINRRHRLNEMLHKRVKEKVADSSISSDIAGKLHDIIDQLWSTKKIAHQQLLSALFNDKSLNKPDQIKMLIEFLDVQKAEIAIKLSVSDIQANVYRYGYKIPYNKMDNKGINRRQKLNELYHEKVNEKLATSAISSDDADKLHTLINDVYRINKALTDPTHQQRLLTELFAGKSLAEGKIFTTKERVRMVVEILDIQASDIRKKLGSGLSPAYKYMKGMIPFDRLDNNGVNKRQLLKELYHKKIETSALGSDDRARLAEIVDELLPTEQTIHQQQLLNFLFTDKSLNDAGKTKLLNNILEVKELEIANKLSLPANYPSSSQYRRGMIPSDRVDSRGINRRQQLNELLHEKVANGDFDDDDADKLHEMIDQLYHIKTP